MRKTCSYCLNILTLLDILLNKFLILKLANSNKRTMREQVVKFHIHTRLHLSQFLDETGWMKKKPLKSCQTVCSRGKAMVCGTVIGSNISCLRCTLHSLNQKMHLLPDGDYANSGNKEQQFSLCCLYVTCCTRWFIAKCQVPK